MGTRALRLTNGVLSMRPLVVLAAKVVGTGPLRLKLVKLAHELDDDRVYIETSRRAA